MIQHARDANGDWLPAIVSADCLSGAEAVMHLARDRLKLFTDEWWEDPDRGNPVLELLRTRRVTEAELSQIANMLSAYIRETDQVTAVADVRISAEGRKINFSCRVLTAYGEQETVSATFQGG